MSIIYWSLRIYIKFVKVSIETFYYLYKYLFYNMKTLNEYIKESLLDDEDDLVNDSTVLIEQFLKDNYEITGSYTIKNKIVNVNGSISLSDEGRSKLTNLTNGLFKFGTITENFTCSSCNTLVTLKGAPEKVKGEFPLWLL